MRDVLPWLRKVPLPFIHQNRILTCFSLQMVSADAYAEIVTALRTFGGNDGIEMKAEEVIKRIKAITGDDGSIVWLAMKLARLSSDVSVATKADLDLLY